MGIVSQRVVLAAGWALLAAGCVDLPALEGVGCDYAHPCGTDYVCKVDICVVRGGLRGWCSNDGHCQDPALPVCVLQSQDPQKNRCGQCSADYPCPVGFCIPSPTGSICVKCRNDGDCASGLCFSGQCKSCQSGLPCPGGSQCVGDRCEGCDQDADCTTSLCHERVCRNCGGELGCNDGRSCSGTVCGPVPPPEES